MFALFATWLSIILRQLGVLNLQPRRAYLPLSFAENVLIISGFLLATPTNRLGRAPWQTQFRVEGTCGKLPNPRNLKRLNPEPHNPIIHPNPKPLTPEPLSRVLESRLGMGGVHVHSGLGDHGVDMGG